MRYSTMLSVMVLTVSIVTGCQDKVMAPSTARVDPLYETKYGKVFVLDGLGEFIAVSEPIVEAGTDRPMMVTVRLRLLADEQINVQYKFEFLTRKGVPVAPESSWSFMALPPRVPMYMQGASLDTSATDWQLKIRSAR